MNYSAPTLNSSGTAINNNSGRFIDISEGIYPERPEFICSTGNIASENYTSWPYTYVTISSKETGPLYIGNARLDKIETKQFKNGESELPTPEREGYTFDGWYDTPDDSTILIEARDHTHNRRTILTNLIPGTTYTISMDSAILNSGIGTNFTVYVYDATGEGKVLNSYTIPFCSSCESFNVTVPSDANANNDLRLLFYAGEAGSTSGNTVTFKNVWVRESGTTRTEYTDDSIFTSYKTLYAHWTPKNENYTVTFDANGGIVTPTSKTVTYASTYGTLPTPTRTGYTFTGWYTATSGGTKIVSTSTVTTTSNHTLHARWTINKVTIKFKVNGGTITKTTTTEDETKTYTWTTDSDGYIYRSTNGGTSSILTNTVKYGATIDLPNYGNSNYLKITRTGYKAVSDAEWKCLSGCTTSGATFDQTADYSPSNFCSITSGNCEVTLGVNWSVNQYTVTFDANGGSVSTASKSVTYGSTYGTLPTPTRSLYSFNGWYTATSGGTKVTSSSTVSITAAQTLYAQWTKNSSTSLFSGTQQIGSNTGSDKTGAWNFTTDVSSYGQITITAGMYSVNSNTIGMRVRAVSSSTASNGSGTVLATFNIDTASESNTVTLPEGTKYIQIQHYGRYSDGDKAYTCALKVTKITGIKR